MNFRPFLLDQWLQEHAGAEFDLGSSTGPRWTVRELLALTGDADRAAQELLSLRIHYPPTAGAVSLREAIAAMQGVQPEDVAVFAGGGEALFHLFYVAAEPGANVIVPHPCYPAHEVLPEALGLEVRRYRLRRENAYAVDLDEVKRLADRNTKLLLVNSPHNPTGATVSDGEMQVLHDFAVAGGIQFVSDEVFHPIYHGRATRSATRLPQATVVGDLSKALSLGGLRLGWIVERDAARRRDYLNAREFVTVSNTPMGEFLGEIAIRHHEQVLARTRAVTGANLKLLDEVMAQSTAVLDWVRPAGGMTAWVRLTTRQLGDALSASGRPLPGSEARPQPDQREGGLSKRWPSHSGGDARAFCTEALNYGLLLAPGEGWGCPDHFRVGFGVGPDWYPRAMQRFAALVQAQAKSPRTRVSQRSRPRSTTTTTAG